MCNSGLFHEIIYDARGIYVGQVCHRCRAATLAPYRPEIFTDGDYWADEPVDED